MAQGWRVTERWLCSFEGRTGSKAHALFISKEQARHFAEQHAFAINSETMAPRWNDTDGECVFDTGLGKYWIMRVEVD
jgi:hypothetical protein